MGRMAELDMEIRERTARGDTPLEIAFCIDIPTHWVTEMIEENAYMDHMEAQTAYQAERLADADAIEYGTR